MVITFSIRIKFVFLLLFLVFNSCKTSGPGIFGKKSLHEQYADKITNAGLKSTALGSSWFKVAEQSISSPLTITVPYKETGYFSADRPDAVGLRFGVLRGQKLIISVERKPVSNFILFIDLWKAAEGNNLPKYLATADTSTYNIQQEVDETTSFVLRLQPELLGNGEYTVSITAGPSLAYPIKAPGKNHIKSFWGADRDGGGRKHEGIDLFAAFRTPVIASANGTVTRVNETPLGGKVVWMRPEKKEYSLYYAHLDTQIVKDGATVKTGDTLGLMGNTGNARFTSPHLHFGIYTFGGAVDPLPFVNPVENEPEKITSSTKLIGKLAKTTASPARIYIQPTTSDKTNTLLPGNTLLRIEAAHSNWYKIRLPDGQKGFIKNVLVIETAKPLRSHTLNSILPLLDNPYSTGAKKTSIPSGETVDILGMFDSYYFVITRNNLTGWIKK